MNNCPQCHAPIQLGAAFCDTCWATLSSIPTAPAGTIAALVVGSGIICPNCQTPAMPGEAFCGECGTRLSQAVAAPAPPAYAPAPPSIPGTLTCSHCGNVLQPGSAFCDQCGKPVTSGAIAQAQPPQQWPSQQPLPAQPPQQWSPMPPQPQPAAPAWPQQAQPAAWTPAQAINPRLIVQATSGVLNLPPGKSEILIGREDPVSGHFPDVNLGPHGSEDGGVSRSHARLIIQGNQCFIEDLNSVNYTHVNKQRLNPGVRHPLNHGDELRLGKIVLLFYVQ